MKVLFDTNVVLDVLLDRQPFSNHSATLLSKVEKGSIAGYLCATSITTLHYLASKAVGSKLARSNIEMLLKLFDVAPVNRQILEGALGLSFSDFEDAVIHEAARNVQADAVVTRNTPDFKKALIPVHSPEELLSLIAAKGELD